MASQAEIRDWGLELNRQLANQPENTWTIARMGLAYPAVSLAQGLVAIDTVVALGSCSAQATTSSLNALLQRYEVEATFGSFELRGQSNLIGRFRILLQDGKRAIGRFRQRYSDRLFPLHGTWEVPFVVECQLGRLIPRPTDAPVVLRSAEPGEFSIPPIGSWFEKWDPIHLVDEKDTDGPTLAVVEHAMHAMLDVGEGPMMPDYLKNWE